MHQTIGDKVAVVWRVTELPTVGKSLFTIRQSLTNAVIFPLPDKSTLQAGRIVESFPIIGKRSI